MTASPSVRIVVAPFLIKHASFVKVLAVADPQHQNNQLVVLNTAYHLIVAYTITPPMELPGGLPVRWFGDRFRDENRGSAEWSFEHPRWWLI